MGLPKGVRSRIQPGEARRGTLGLVRFSRGDVDVNIFCEISNVSESGYLLEIEAIASDRTSLWIPIEDFYIRT